MKDDTLILSSPLLTTSPHSTMIAVPPTGQQSITTTSSLFSSSPSSTSVTPPPATFSQPIQNIPFPNMPGSWFYEEGHEGLSCSPISDSEEAALFMNSRAGVRNVTQSVEVPSSEHVAEIVGRQGCKIKALRAKTNTYIKTPIRGEEPVFVVTGRPEDVNEAKREIECAAEHFTQIRASRRHSQGGAPAPGHVTTYVRVPLRVVGLVVGPKGATIKRIQQDTHTYIITPSREREPIFEVTGLPHNVEAARKEIEHHIYHRTGNMPITDPSSGLSQFSNGIPLNHESSLPNANGVSRGATPASNSFGLSQDFSSNEFTRQMENSIGFDSLLRSFPSMRGCLTQDAFSGFQPHRHSLGGNASLNPSNALNRMRNMTGSTMSINAKSNQNEMNLSRLMGYGPWSTGENDILSSRNFDSFGYSSVWSSLNGKEENKNFYQQHHHNNYQQQYKQQPMKQQMHQRNDSPTNGLISLNGGSNAGFGILQSIWSDMSAAGSSTTDSPPSASPKSSCENEKTIIA